MKPSWGETYGKLAMGHKIYTELRARYLCDMRSLQQTLKET